MSLISSSYIWIGCLRIYFFTFYGRRRIPLHIHYEAFNTHLTLKIKNCLSYLCHLVGPCSIPCVLLQAPSHYVIEVFRPSRTKHRNLNTFIHHHTTHTRKRKFPFCEFIDRDTERPNITCQNWFGIVGETLWTHIGRCTSL